MKKEIMIGDFICAIDNTSHFITGVVNKIHAEPNKLYYSIKENPNACISDEQVIKIVRD